MKTKHKVTIDTVKNFFGLTEWHRKELTRALRWYIFIVLGKREDP